ncbi:MAG: LysR family transcriptional regulator [Rhizobiaceae bacterium]|nr:LysR family transcriptional regulator [Rhizobiaceae bacterium]
MSQPALSSGIKELERQLGFALFERNSRRVQLTLEGRTLLVNARRVVLETDWLQQRAKDIRTNDLRIGVQYYSALVDERTDLTDLFSRAHPAISMRVLTFDPHDLYESVRSGEADLALAIEPSDRTELSPIGRDGSTEFEVATIARKPLSLLVPAGDPLAARASVSAADLAGREIATINRFHGGAMGSAILRQLLGIGASVVRPPEGDVVSVKRYASLNNILAIDVGWFSIPDATGAGAMRSVRLEGADRFSDLVMIRHRRGQRPAAALFWQFALERAAPD